jgi:hypothetical protein
MEAFEDLKFVFYIAMGETLPKYYYDLAHALREVDLTLVPVQLDQLLIMHQGKKRIHAVCVTSNMREFKIFQKRIKKVLKQSIMSKLLSLYHLSSFSKLNLHNELGRMDNYHFVNLPVQDKTFAHALLKFYKVAINNVKKWPGGRRGKLPNYVGE